jgi:drug/metabolite transporter (DMT)-like permease
LNDALVPILFALTAAMLFGGQWVLTVRSFAYVDPQTSSMSTVGICVGVLWLLAPFFLEAHYFTNIALWIFLANGLIFPVFSMYLAFEASKRMGPTVAATISATAPLFATAGAVAILGEDITIIFMMGTFCTVSGIMLISWKQQGRIDWALSAIGFPLGAAVIRAGSQIIVKSGLAFLPSPFFACLISFTVSFAAAICIYRFRTGSLPGRLPWQCFVWNGLAGICIAGGILCMFSALHYGRVVVVSPIVATFPFFTLLISLLFRQERFRLRILIGVVLVVAGVIWISIQ